MEYDAVVYDLDNTLVELAVDWQAVADEVSGLLADEGVEPPGNLWAMLDRAAETGHAEAVESIIAEHEREGARGASRLRAADNLPHDVPVGVCSLNCEAACRLALEAHALDPHVDAVVGRDSGPWKKPDPGPLLAALDALDVPPERAVFVGDSESDAEAAAAAGVTYVDVDDWPSE